MIITHHTWSFRIWIFFSNLTFGSGGKDKDGNNVTGYGYYEVRTTHRVHRASIHPLPRTILLTSPSFRPLLAVRALVRAGTAPLAFIHTLLTLVSATLRSWNAAILYSSTSSD